MLFASDCHVDRYEFKQISEARRDQFLIDTMTGRVWGVFVSKEDITFFSPILFSDGELKPSTNGAKNENGRYELKQISDVRRDQYLIDNATGRVWNIVLRGKSEDSGELVFSPMPFDGGGYSPDIE